MGLDHGNAKDQGRVDHGAAEALAREASGPRWGITGLASSDCGGAYGFCNWTPVAGTYSRAYVES